MTSETGNFRLGATLARFTRPLGAGGPMELSLIPWSRRNDVARPRTELDEDCVLSLPARWRPLPSHSPDSLVHIHVSGDSRPAGFAQGRTLAAGPSVKNFRLVSQERLARPDGEEIQTLLETPHGLRVEHVLMHRPEHGGCRVLTRIRNVSTEPRTLELLTSFSLSGITPFHAADAPGRLFVHRFRSTWSAESRHECRSLEALQLERSWTGHGMAAERFGQIGSKPTNGWFPLVAIEDREAGVFWGAQLHAPGSWQLEVRRRGDRVALSGGLADREFGHWKRTLAPGEIFEAPPAAVACVAGTLEDLCDALLATQVPAALAQPAVEQDLPVVFNEWCTSWGNPTHDNLVALADRLKGSGVRYLVIDDGWAERSSGALLQENGDWRVDRRAFPRGLKATCDAIRERGLIPGIWFEHEGVNAGADAFSETAHLLHLDGHVLQVGARRFWDFRDPWVHEYLAQRMIALLRDAGFGYLKIDYNDTLGLGCDGAESPGEGLRQHVAGVQKFLARIRAELPDLVIENCSSGGHRLEPSFMALAAMGSFSDAHETPELPLIAANLHRQILPRQTQVWVVFRQGDSRERLTYSLAAGFLGRPCLSGEVHALDEAQWSLVVEALEFYRIAAPLIARARFRRAMNVGESWRHLTGHQVVIASGDDDALVVWHAFGAAPPVIGVRLPPGHWLITRRFGAAIAILEPERLALDPGGSWRGGAFLLRRSPRFTPLPGSHELGRDLI